MIQLQPSRGSYHLSDLFALNLGSKNVWRTNVVISFNKAARITTPLCLEKSIKLSFLVFLQQ